MYAKIFHQIYDSSIADDWETRVVFMDLLILADRDGFVDMTHEAIAARTRLPLEMVNKAVNMLTQPDEKSRTPDHDGRRLLPIDPRRGWGWKVVNYEKYRTIRDENDRKSYMRKYMQEYRKAKAESDVNSVNSVNNLLASPISVSVVSTKEGECEGKPKQKLDAIQIRINKLKHRRDSTRWSNAELKAYRAIQPVDEEDLTILERYYAAKIPENKDYRRKELLTLLNNWNGEVDRARNFKQPSIF